MKRIASILTGLSLAVLFFVASAHAQYDGQRIIANIPFEFTAGNTSFPAGQYEFVRTGPYVVVIRDANGRSQFITASAAIRPSWLSEKSTVKFEVVDGRHVLVQIWNDLAGTGNDFPYADTSAELAKQSTIDGTVTGRH